MSRLTSQRNEQSDQPSRAIGFHDLSFYFSESNITANRVTPGMHMNFATHCFLAVLLGSAATVAIAFDNGPEESPDCCDAHTIRRSDIPKAAPQFAQYPAAQALPAKAVNPDVRSHPLSRMFRTAIRKGAKNGPNFADHYTVVRWGCGSDCLQFAFIDARTGKVHHPPNFRTYQSWNIDDSALWISTGKQSDGIDFSLTSRLLVVVGGINDDPRLRGISYFLWEKDHLRRIRFIHRE
jgi:hypothetical protein